MPEPFKNLINEHTVRAAARNLQAAWPAFDARAFEHKALKGLAALEMKARAMQIADALEATLPAHFPQAAQVIEDSLAPVVAASDTLAEPAGGSNAATVAGQGLTGWVLWGVGDYVARRGMEHPERALQALHALTQRFTAEWAIRPFIVRHPQLCWDTLARWSRDPSAHVRRLVSEGSRPRLPWGLQLKGLIHDPSPTLPLLQALQDDPSDNVRRSVANHLNDIAKDHPAVVAEWVETHLPNAPALRRALLKHACRTLVKKGDPRILSVWGLGRRLRGLASISVSPARVTVGDSLTIEVTLQSASPRAQKLAIDYAVHHVKANGATSAKVFKGWMLDLAGQQERNLVKRHSMRAITTRRYHPGRHEVDLRVNGEIMARATFDLMT